MSYTLSLTNGNPLISNGLPDGTVDTTTTSLTLIGKNYPGYGKLLNENFVQLLENFANTTGPSAALPGQLWWDSASKALKVNTATAAGQNAIWKTLASIVNAASRDAAVAVSTPLVGDLWWDTVNQQLKIYSGVPTIGDAGWVTIGPVNNTTTGQSGAVPDTIVDTLNIPHVVIKFYISNDIYAIFSKDLAEWTPATPITGFSTIRQGINLFSGVAGTNYQFYGNANVAYSLMVNGTPVSATNFARTDVVTVSTVPIFTTNNSGLSFGLTGNVVANIDPSSGHVGVYSTINNKDIRFFSNVAGTLDMGAPIFKINSTAGVAEVNTDPDPASGVRPSQISTKNYVDTANAYVRSVTIPSTGGTISGNLVPSANVTYDLGSSTAWFNNVYGKSYQARYADLAERFESDSPYSAGTVVELGGEHEITAVRDELSETVFGVISTQAAYLMNGSAGTDETHPAVAVSGRVPVNVVGKVCKGDRLVSAGNGIARAASKDELTPWNVIGRSLQNKYDDGHGTVEAIVKLNS
jgi:hypothetical protein